MKKNKMLLAKSFQIISVLKLIKIISFFPAKLVLYCHIRKFSNSIFRKSDSHHNNKKNNKWNKFTAFVIKRLKLM